MMRTRAVLLACLGSLLACGNLGDEDDTPPLVVLQGQLRQSTTNAPAAAQNVRVAVIWQTTTDFKSTHDLAVTPVFPSQFRLELREPPPAEAMRALPVESEADATQDNPNGDGPASRSRPLANGDHARFAMAVGTVVAYEDLNGNGRLDLIRADVAPLDRVLGTNEELHILYVEGTAPPQFHGATSSPSPGYNLFRSVSCRFGETCTGQSAWLPVTTLYDLPLSADPKLAELMCGETSTVSEASADIGKGHVDESTPFAPGPRGWPKAGDLGLVCYPKEKAYRLTTCVEISKGLCKGTSSSCTIEAFRMPDPPPAEWPCPL